MNRTVSGIAAFALLMGASLVMTDSKAEAGGLLAKLMGKGCGGCAAPAPEPVCCPEPEPTCGGGGGLLAKLRARRAANDCCAPEPVCCPAPEPVCCPEPAPKCGGGGLLAKLKARRAAKKCCAPEPTCCEPAPAPCCEPAPAPCCEPAPAPCCEPAPAPAPCCGAAPAPAPCCGGEATISYGAEAPMEPTPVVGAVPAEGYDLAPGETLVPGSVRTIEAEGEEGSASDEAPAETDEAPPAPAADESA